MGSQFMGPAMEQAMFRNPALYRQQMAIREGQYNGNKAGEQGARDMALALAYNKGRAKPESTAGVPTGRR